MPNSSFVVGTPDSMSSDRWTDGWWSWPAAVPAGSTTSRVLFWLENIAIIGLSKVKGPTPGQLRSEVKGRSGRKDFGTPGLGKMSTFFQK